MGVAHLSFLQGTNDNNYEKHNAIGGNFSFNIHKSTNQQKIERELKENLLPITTNVFQTKNLAKDIDFILNHFPEPVFPRTISTYNSHGKQFEVFGKEEMLAAYEASNFTDCRVNAYPVYTQYKGIQRFPPNFIFADLDISFFKSETALKRGLTKTLNRIKANLNGSPTVLWTGNGYHIYQPIDAIILEESVLFELFENPSSKFIRFAEHYLSAGKSDPCHKPSFKSSMIRIPGSFNSKLIEGQKEVKIIQKWDGCRPPMKLLIGTFYAFPVEQKMKEKELRKRVKKIFGRSYQNHSILWIETLLQTPVDDYRKYIIAVILAPYLINIKKLPYLAASAIIKDWLGKCNKLRHLDSNFDYKIKYSLNVAIMRLQLPMRFETLKKKNKKIYDLLSLKMQGLRN